MSTIVEAVRVDRIEAVQQIVLGARKVLAKGGGSKPALSRTPPGAVMLEMGGLRGITEYQPSEFTISALAGTPLAEIDAALAEHGQYMPFDPPLIEQGATLGGAIASGLSGSLRYRYGGLRDFLIGVRLVDGRGRLVRGGGKVVKNAAGFDLPKLLVGSLGRLGVIVEATFKVFPRPEGFASVRVDVESVEAGAALLRRLATAPLEIQALDLVAGEPAAVWIRLGGARSTLPEREKRLGALLDRGEIVTSDEDAAFWRSQREFTWAAERPLLARLLTDPHHLAALDTFLLDLGAIRRYSAGGHVAWFACDTSPAPLIEALRRAGKSALLLRGDGASPLVGAWTIDVVTRRVRSVLDPENRFLEY